MSPEEPHCPELGGGAGASRNSPFLLLPPAVSLCPMILPGFSALSGRMVLAPNPAEGPLAALSY
jgi:hypothetical protein